MDDSEKSPAVVSDKVCRSCMSVGTDMKSVFSQAEMAGHEAQLAEMLMACASVQVVSGDGLPGVICEPCVHQLSSAYSFKQQCENTDTKLRQLLPKIKQEDKDSDSLNIVVKPDIDVMAEDFMYPDTQFDDYSDSGDESKRMKPTKNSKISANQCKYCLKKLASKEGLKIHMRKHTGENLRHCLVCNAGFTKTSHLTRHMQEVHSKIKSETTSKTHVCNLCGEGFTRAYHLSKHKKEHREKDESVGDGIKTETPENNDEIDLNDSMAADNIMNDDSDNSAGDPSYATQKRKSKKSTGEEYPCKVCHKVLTTSTGLEIHMRRHTGLDLSACHICSKTFTKTNHLNRHLTSHGITAERVFKERKSECKSKVSMPCEYCDRKFVYRKSFQHHLKTEHGISDDESSLTNFIKTEEQPIQPKVEEGEVPADLQSEIQRLTEGVGLEDEEDEVDQEGFDMNDKKAKVYECHVCQYKFDRANHLTRHMTLHRAILTHKCERCEKAFLTEEHLAQHVQEYHIDRPYVCTTCDKPFVRGEHLIRHLKVHEKKDESEHKCSICTKVFQRADHLARHVKLHLLQDKRHICTVCNKAFNRLDNLRTHQRIHSGQRDPVRLHLCVYCGKEFNNSSNMIVHMRRHTGERPYKCAECGKGFPRSHDLKCHERTHSGERPYLCTLCGKSFNKSNKLVRHTRVHTGERPYVCSLCGRAFTQSNDLALHMRRHTGSRPYACGVCPARFIQSGQLKAHRRSQGHWVEQEQQFRGNRVEPVHIEGFVETPIKHRNRVSKIKIEQLLPLTTSSIASSIASGLVTSIAANIASESTNNSTVSAFLSPTTENDSGVTITPLRNTEPNTTSAFVPTTSYQNSIATASNSFSDNENFSFQQYG